MAYLLEVIEAAVYPEQLCLLGIFLVLATTQTGKRRDLRLDISAILI